jgi:hypothetical protein
MPAHFFDEYAFELDSLLAALQNSYDNLKGVSLSRKDLDYSRVIVERLRAFYFAQERIKKFLNKQVAQAGADFFVEAILFSLKLFNEIEGLQLEIASERAIKRKRKTIRPDISVWRGDALLAAIECKTQLGWRRHDWASHFDVREQKLKATFPDAKMFLLVMTNCNWSGFGNDARSGKQLLCLRKDRWPTQIPKSFDPSILDTPIEQLLEKLECL